MKKKLIVEARIEIPVAEEDRQAVEDNIDLAQEEAMRMLQEKFVDEGAEFEVFAELREVD